MNIETMPKYRNTILLMYSLQTYIGVCYPGDTAKWLPTAPGVCPKVCSEHVPNVCALTWIS